MRNSFLLILSFIIITSSGASVLPIVIDTKEALTVEQFTCLNKLGYFNFVAHLYYPEGYVDQVGVQNLVNANKAGVFTHAYITPCTSGICKNNITKSEDQVQEVMNALYPNMLQHNFLYVEVDSKN
uniref:Uncharacterized protein n=1 Tax=Acrobeloides nanus TaxID=290746 RepID=A0A914C3J2_9BILA